MIDVHTHAFPNALAPHAMSHLIELGDIPAYTDGTADDLRRSMAEAGIQRSVLCNIAVKPGQADKVNGFAATFLNDPQFIPLASVHPKEEDWKGALRRIKEAGFCGIKLHPGYQDFFINDPTLEPFYLEAFAQGLFLMFHAGWDAGYPDPMHASPQRIYDILPVLEQGTVVLAHLGGNMRPKEVLSLLAGRNLYFDTAYSLEKIPIEDVKALITKHTPDRFLFGTDAPWASQKIYVDYFKNTVAPGFLSSTDQEKILHQNAAQLLGIT